MKSCHMPSYRVRSSVSMVEEGSKGMSYGTASKIFKNFFLVEVMISVSSYW